MKFYGFIFMMKLGARILPKDFDIPDKKVTFQKFPLEVSGGFDSCLCFGGCALKVMGCAFILESAFSIIIYIIL